MFIPFLLVAYLLYLLARRFVVNSKLRHIVLFGIMFAVTCIALPFVWKLISSAQLRHERQAQRMKVNSRIAQVGGWEAVRLGCEALVTNYPGGLTWFPPRSNAWVYPNPQAEPHRHYVTNLDYGPLPRAVAALQPKLIRYCPPSLLRNFKDESQVAVLRLKIFGMGHATPYYGLEVPCGAGAESYQPRASHDGVSGNRKPIYERVADRVFEVY